MIQPLPLSLLALRGPADLPWWHSNCFLLGTCIPYGKVKLWKSDSVTFLKMGLGVFFKKVWTRGYCFKLFWKNGSIFKLSLKKYRTRLGPGSWALAPVHPGPGPRGRINQCCGVYCVLLRCFSKPCESALIDKPLLHHVDNGLVCVCVLMYI